MKLNPGYVLADRYEIADKLGSGGMAVVYRARDKKLDRYVTIKVMREEFATDDEFITRFNVEARAAASLSNQNVVNVYDVGQEDSVHYIVMEYIDGVTLKDLIKKRAPFEIDEILGVAIQIAAGIQHAHQNNIVHRDIKPQNILVTTKGIVKVTDFGIARAATANTVATGTGTMGSVHYFSPEQARGGYVDYKSDIYALGIVMFEMATGRLPFEGDSAVAVAMKHVNDPLPDIRAINPGITDSLQKIIQKATEKLSSKRYQTIEEMSSDLKRALTNTAGDFVDRDSGVLENNPTVKLSEEDFDAIKREAKSVYYDDDGEDEDYREDYYGYDGMEPYQDDYDDYDEAEDKATERKIKIAAVLTAIALIALISSIVLYVYQRNKPVPVAAPDLRGMTLEAAESAAGELGLLVSQVDEAYDDDVPAGLIIYQSVTPDQELYPDSAIQVIISLGTNKIPVPSFVNKEISEVENMDVFVNKELILNENMVFHENVPSNVVIDQSPEANEMVPDGTVVTVTVSLGPEQKKIIVPELKGKTEAEAIEALQGLGLVVGTPTKVESTTVAEGLIVSQTRAAGTEVSQGTAISYAVSLGAPEPTPTPTPETIASEISKPLQVDPSIPEDVEKIHLRIYKITAESAAETFFDEEVEVSRFPLNFTVTGVGEAEFQIYSIDEEGITTHLGSETIIFSESGSED